MLLRSISCAAVVLFLGVGRIAQGQLLPRDDIWAPTWDVTEIDAFIRFTGVGLGTGRTEEIRPPAPTNVKSFPFSAVARDSADFVQPNGGVNHGMWEVSQQTTFSPWGLSTNMMQSAVTTTDGGSPGVFLESSLDVTFQVNSPVTICLEGAANGSPIPGSTNFARVLLREGTVNQFVSFTGEYVFCDGLQAGEVYSLQARVRGESTFDSMTESSIDLNVALTPMPTIKSFDVYDETIYITYTHPDGSGLTILRPGSRQESYVLGANDHVVSSRIYPGPEGFAVVSINPDEPQNLNASSFHLGQARISGFTGPLEFLSSIRSEPYRPETAVLLGLGDGTFQGVDAVISTRDAVSGLPTGKRFGALLVERGEQSAIAFWEWDEAPSSGVIDDPFFFDVPAELLVGTGHPTKVDFIDGVADHTVGAFASESGVTLVDFENFTSTDPLPPGLTLLSTVDAGDVPFAPDTLRAGSGAAGQPAFSIQQGNSLLLYEYNGTSLEMRAVQQLPAGASAFFNPNNTELIIKLQDNQLQYGRFGGPAGQLIGFDDVDVALDASTPADSATSRVSLKGNSAITVDASYVAPPGTGRIEAIAEKDAVLQLHGDMDASDMRYTANGRRAVVVTHGSVAGEVTSHGNEVARTIVMSNPPPNMPSDPFDDAFAAAAMELAHPAALARLRESLGMEAVDQVGDMLDALVVSDTQGGTREAVLEYRPVEESSIHEASFVYATNDPLAQADVDGHFHATIPGFGSVGEDTVTGAVVAPNGYLIASNNAFAPAAVQLAQTAAADLGTSVSHVIVAGWENLHLEADATHPTMQAEVHLQSQPDGLRSEIFILNLLYWSEDVSGTAEGTLSVEIGYAGAEDPENRDILASISGSPADVAVQLADGLVVDPRNRDTVYVRLLLDAPPGGIAHFTNSAGLIHLLPATLAGDYNGNGTVEQGDLDLALLNWGNEIADPVAAGWVSDLPSGLIDQVELDKVLLNWGNARSVGAARVPEPPAWLLALVTALACCRGRRADSGWHGAARHLVTRIAIGSGRATQPVR